MIGLVLGLMLAQALALYALAMRIDDDRKRIEQVEQELRKPLYIVTDEPDPPREYTVN